MLLAAFLTSAAPAWAQTVLYPAAEKPGEAHLTEGDNTWTLSNNLLSATFTSDGQHLTFGGCEALDLAPANELFTLNLSAGRTVSSNSMRLTSVSSERLTGNPNATKGSDRFNGWQIKAQYTYNSLRLEWTVVLRDGSHYLRTNLDINASANYDFKSIIPMHYEVYNRHGEPKVVGNTRGAILTTNRIFAGLETPMGVNKTGVGQASVPFSPTTWEPGSFIEMAATDVPNEVLSLKPRRGTSWFTTGSFLVSQGLVDIAAGGQLTCTFVYKSGSKGLSIVGVDLLKNGQVVAKDYHTGFTGSNHENNIYTLSVPEAGRYTLRYIVEILTEEAVNSEGNIGLGGPQVTPFTPEQDPTATTPIEGVWERPTTLKRGETWSVSTVVGLIAQDEQQNQARRSVLAYIERERAVPWRSFALYNSWYELNINRTNNYQTSLNDYSRCMTEEQCLDVLTQWKTKLFDVYGVAPKSFVWDDGWDSYGDWGFNRGFPNGFTNLSNAVAAMNSNIGAWLGPKGGYDRAGAVRQQYWTNKGKTMGLADSEYYNVFLNACTSMLTNYNFNCFKFDGLSGIADATGPNPTDSGLEDCEGIISIEEKLRKNVKDDVFIYTTAGSWASPFWFKYTDATWRQCDDWNVIGNQGDKREQWITYRDNLVHDRYVVNSPLCPINDIMTHGIMVTNFGPPAAMPDDYEGIVREIRCAFGCGSAMVELYTDYAKLNNINNGKLWGEIAKCLRWHEDNADVFGDVHWVGGDPWDGTKASVYGWAAWNEQKAVVTFRNPSSSIQTLSITPRQMFEIPSHITDSIHFEPAFDDQRRLAVTSRTFHPDHVINLRMPPNYVAAFNCQPVKAGDPSGIKPATASAARIAIVPAKGSIAIGGAAAGTIVEVYNLTGQRIRQLTISESSATIDIAQPGTYVVKATAPNGQQTTKKVNCTK